MAPVTKRIAHDDEAFDDTIHDRRYYPRKVFKDGCGPRVRLMLTDGAPAEWMRTPRRPLFNQPRYAVVDAADPHVQAAERAYADHNAYLRDAWKTMPGGAGGAPLTTAPGADAPEADDDNLSPRDRYIRQLGEAWRTPIGQADPSGGANPIERLRQQWLTPGARPGPGMGYRDARPAVSRETATKDAAADREQAYAGYLDRLTNGWRK